MIKIGDWSIRQVPETLQFKLPNYEEKFLIYYKDHMVGSLFFCEFDNEWWVRILRDKIRNKYYQDDSRFVYRDVVKLPTGKILYAKNNQVLAHILVKLFNIDTENQNYDGKFYYRVILGECFDKFYFDKVSDTEILKDIKVAVPRIGEVMTDRQIKKSIIKIFQFPNLKMKLNGKICKLR